MKTCHIWSSALALMALSSPVGAEQELEVDDLDLDFFSYNPAAQWQEFSDNELGLFGNGIHFSQELGGSFTFKFPVAGTAFRFMGMQRSTGANYTLCVDGQLEDCYVVSAYNVSADPLPTPSILFEMTDLTYANHTIEVTNQYDTRVPAVGELTVDSFIVYYPDPSSPTASAQSSTATSASSPTSSSSSSANNAAASDPGLSSQNRTIIIATSCTVGGIFLIGLGVLLYFRRRWSRRPPVSARTSKTLVDPEASITTFGRQDSPIPDPTPDELALLPNPHDSMSRPQSVIISRSESLRRMYDFAQMPPLPSASLSSSSTSPGKRISISSLSISSRWTDNSPTRSASWRSTDSIPSVYHGVR